MKKLKSHFKFTKQERSGLFFLLLIIVVLQVGYFVYGAINQTKATEWLEVDHEAQAQIDILKANVLKKDSFKIFPFNPNFITDYKGYTLGMSADEIDRLHAFRAQNKFTNSAEEFQTVTRISDSLLNAISPYFKFPEWTRSHGRSSVGEGKFIAVDLKRSRNDVQQKDLNTASAEDLKTINGIGEKLSARIVKFRERLGGFLVDEQLYDVYGLEMEVVEKTLKKFKVMNPPRVTKININTATAEEIGKLVYLQRHVAEGIVAHRNLNGTIKSFDELSKIEDFPKDKIARIALYLSLN